MTCPTQRMFITCSLKLGQQTLFCCMRLSTALWPTNALLHIDQCHSFVDVDIEQVAQYAIAPHLYTSVLNALGMCRETEWRGKGVEVEVGGGILFRERAVCFWPQSWRARDTFSVITCRHISTERRRFSHCFLSVLIWWMLSGTQHVSLETSWKSGGHWRHLKGLFQAGIHCPDNVFHWGNTTHPAFSLHFKSVLTHV